MSNRNFDSRVIIQRLQEKNYAHNLYFNNISGQRIINNPQTSDSNASRYNQFHSGAQTTYFRGLDGNCVTVNSGGTCNIPPFFTTPSAPTITSVVSGVSQVTIFFTFPVSDGGSPILYYQYSIDGGVTFINTGLIFGSFTITGLENGTPYEIVIRAVNAEGPGQNSNMVIGIPFEYGWILYSSTSISQNNSGYITTDTFGNIYNALTQGGRITFNYYSSLTNGIINTSPYGILSTNGLLADPILAKYNTLGKIEWATFISSPSNTVADRSFGVTTDNLNNVYNSGFVSSSAFVFNFDNINTTTTQISTSLFGRLVGLGGADGYVAKYTSSGKALWVTNITGTSAEQAIGLNYNSTINSLYLAGQFTTSSFIYSYNSISTNDTNSTILTNLFGRLTVNNLTTPSQDNCIIKYNTNGKVEWATNIGGTSLDITFLITSDNSGNVYNAGAYTSLNLSTNSFIGVSATSDSTINQTLFGTLANTNIVGRNAYVIKYNTLGQVQWATRFGGNNTAANSIAFDSIDSIFVTGNYEYSTSLYSYNSNTGTVINTELSGTLYQQSSARGHFITKYDLNGKLQIATKIEAFGTNVLEGAGGAGLAIDKYRNIYIYGFFFSSLNVYDYNSISTNDTNSTIITSLYGTIGGLGQRDVYLVKYNSSLKAQWATIIGGADADTSFSNTVDNFGNIYINSNIGGGTPVITTIYNFTGISPNSTILVSSVGTITLPGRSIYTIKYNTNGQVVFDPSTVFTS